MNKKLQDVLAKIRSLVWQKPGFVFVTLGDSTAEGVGASHKEKTFAAIIYNVLKQENKKAKFFNLGRSRAKIRDVIDHQLPQIIDLKPDLTLISVGANDLRARTKISDFERDFEYLIEELKNKTNSKIIVSSIPDFSNLPSISFFLHFFVKKLIEKFNKVLRKKAEEKNIIFVDLHWGSRVFTKKYPELISEDGFHPSDMGYALWAAVIISQAKEHLLKKN